MVELLAPAGNPEALDAAIGEGADAVYLGLKNFNARLRSSNFTWSQFEAALKRVHKIGKKIYVTINTVIEERETEELFRLLKFLSDLGPDALIVQDFSVLRMCHEFFPNLTLHASTQMNVESAVAVNFLSKNGIKRVVLARELDLNEIKKIKAQTNVELEIFVHGALCTSESGLCLFSSFLGGKSANRGMCAQACRRFYNAHFPTGEKSGFYFSSADLQLVEKIPDLVQTGISSFKIEGRMKSAEYVAAVVRAYRFLLDNFQSEKRGAISTAKRILAGDFARPKTLYRFLFEDSELAAKNVANEILNPGQSGATGIFLGKIEKTKSILIDEQKILFAQISGANYAPQKGDSIRLQKKDDGERKSAKVKFVKNDLELNFYAKKSQKSQKKLKTEQIFAEKTWFSIPEGFSTGDSVFLLQTKSAQIHYKKILPQKLSQFKKRPGNEILPILDLTPVKKNELLYFPKGIWVRVSTLKDFFTVQSINPVRTILELNFQSQSELKNLVEKKSSLPISKKSTVISLDPFCAENSILDLENTIDFLIQNGFSTFIAENLAHIALLRKKNATIIAGEYLYTFNRWAISWLENQNIGAFITPLENSKRNLFQTFEKSVRDRVMITTFAYPALFRMRFSLPEDYDFSYFSDKTEKNFKILSWPESSFVMGCEPFSILDRTEDLKTEGFSRFLIDFSRTNVLKSDLKKITTAILKKTPLPFATRFNWKDGFFSEENGRKNEKI